MYLPGLVERLLTECDAYLVGSAAEGMFIEQEYQPKDFDVIVPPNEFNKALLICKEYGFIKLKRLGGLKMWDEAYIDIWSMSLGDFYMTLPERYSGYAMNKNREFIKRL